MSELLLEALRAFLKRRLRRRLCNSNSWTGGALGCIVADCAFSSEPYAFVVHALAAFLDDAPRMACRKKRVNWISQAFGVLTHSLEEETNWIESTFRALATESHVT